MITLSIPSSSRAGLTHLVRFDDGLTSSSCDCEFYQRIGLKSGTACKHIVTATELIASNPELAKPTTRLEGNPFMY